MNKNEPTTPVNRARTQCIGTVKSEAFAYFNWFVGGTFQATIFFALICISFGCNVQIKWAGGKRRLFFMPLIQCRIKVAAFFPDCCCCALCERWAWAESKEFHLWWRRSIYKGSGVHSAHTLTRYLVNYMLSSHTHKHISHADTFELVRFCSVAASYPCALSYCLFCSSYITIVAYHSILDDQASGLKSNLAQNEQKRLGSNAHCKITPISDDCCELLSGAWFMEYAVFNEFKSKSTAWDPLEWWAPAQLQTMNSPKTNDFCALVCWFAEPKANFPTTCSSHLCHACMSAPRHWLKIN